MFRSMGPCLACSATVAMETMFGVLGNRCYGDHVWRARQPLLWRPCLACSATVAMPDRRRSQGGIVAARHKSVFYDLIVF